MTSEPKNQFKQTEIGKIPEDWDVKSLSDIAEFVYGKMPKKEDIVSEGYPIFSGYRITGFHKTHTSTKPKLILVARGVGGTGDIKIAPPMTFITNLSIIFDLNEDSINLQFLYYYLHKGLRYLDSGSAQSQITISDLRQVKVAVPLLSEQQAIAKVFSDIDSKIELNQRMNKTLEAIGQAIFKRWFIDFEFPNEERKPYKSSGGKMIYSEELKKEIPEAWAVGTIGDLCVSITNGGTPKRMESRFWNGNIVWFKTGELTDGPLIDSEEHITEEGLSNSACKLWDKNTILVALYAAPTVGRLGLLRTKATSNQACSGLVARKEIGHSFLFYNMLFKRNEFNNIAVGAAQQNISQQIVRENKTIIPLSLVLNRFNVLVDSLFDKQTELIQQNKTLSQIRDAILPKLMSGKIRVPVSVENVEA